MANVDTGLGWSAESSYLLATPGAICTLQKLIFNTYQPLYLNTYSDPITANIINIYGTEVISNLGDGNYIKALSPEPSVFVVRIMSSDATTFNRSNIYFFSPTTVTIYCNWHMGRFSGTGSSITINSQVSGHQLYYKVMSNSYFNENVSASRIINCPTYNTLEDAIADITFDLQNYYKLYNGPSVFATIAWKRPNGKTGWVPVLISSERLNTVLSADGVDIITPTALLQIQYNGIRFYMRYLDLDGYALISSAAPRIDISSVIASETQVFHGIAGPSYANILVTETVDPYDPFGNTEEGGGETDPNPQDDDIEEEELPTLSFSSAGFARIYRPSLQQINDLADYMWTDQTFLQTVINHLKQLLENPMDAVISLGLVPCVPPVGADVPVKVMFVNTGVSMPPVTNQFVQVDCGSFTLKEMYGSALDYNPYTKVQLYLPYVGTVKLDTDEVMGKTLQVKYNIDVVTGVCCAYVIAGGDVLYQFSGHCSINQPISSADFSSYINAAIAAAKVGIAAATGGAAAAAGAAASGAQAPSAPATPASSGQAASETPALQSTSLTVPGKSAPLVPYNQAPATVSNKTQASFAELAKPGNINTVASAMGGKIDVMHSGGFGGNSGYLAAVRRPYLIITRPRIANPQQYGQFNGRPSMMYLNLGSCTGYTQVQSVYLTGFDATNPELAEISELLKGGVVL